MTYKEFVEMHIKFLADNPECANHFVVYSQDDEGNGFHEVFYGPSSGLFKEWEFNQDCKEEETNAICIN